MVNTKEQQYKKSSAINSTMAKSKKTNSASTSKEASYTIINKPKNPKGNRMRRKTNAEDRELLYSIYSRIKNPDSATRKDIAKTLGWPERSVRIWFQNMRQKDASRAKAGLVSFPALPDQDAFNVVNEITAQQSFIKRQEPSPLPPDMTVFLPHHPLLHPQSPTMHDIHQAYPWNHFFTHMLDPSPSTTPFLVNPNDLHPCLPPHESEFITMNAFLNPAFTCTDTSSST